MSEYEAFIRDAAQRRGIDPDIAVRVANSEGSVTEPARRGTFPTGSSWWAFQLHYGGAGYEHFGTTAGMGNGFTAFTGWQPGDPDAWRDATRYALNRAKAGGWGAWYGAAHIGIGRWAGIDRNAPWDANSEVWDFEDQGGPMPSRTYNPDFPLQLQRQEWACAIRSTQMLLNSVGIDPDIGDLQDDMVGHGLVTAANGLEVATGLPLARWLAQQYGVPARNDGEATFDEIAELAGQQPLIFGLRNWGGPRLGHWAAARRMQDGRIVVANPGGTGPKFGHQTLSRGEFDARGPASYITIDLAAAPPVVAPPPSDPRAARIAELEQVLGVQRDTLLERDAHILELNEKLANERTKLGVWQERYGPTMRDALDAALRDLVPGN